MVVLSSSAASPTHLIYPTTLPSVPDHLSVLSYNVLLPNSIDGWWNYKMYHPTTEDEYNIENIYKISTWEYRSSLLKTKIQQINPDIVCMQEVSPESFTQDFEFMLELGYDGVEMFRRGRFRPATFWKKEKCTLVTDAVHKDRTLLTVFQLNGLENSHPSYGRNWHVLNCHLQAGPEGKRRVRQIDDGVKSSVRAAKTLKESDPTNPLLIVCGDFNGASECGAVHYLEAGGVDPTFIEDGQAVTSKVKKSPLAHPMMDVAASTSRKSNNNDDDDGNNPPPTLVVSELISQMVGEGSEAYQKPQLSTLLIERLQRCYKKYASFESGTDELVMNKCDVERWLIDINKQVGRGDEFRTAAREMGWTEPQEEKDEDEGGQDNTNEKSPGEQKKKEKPRIYLPEDGILTLDGFLNVYRRELDNGKFWGIASDLAVMGEMLPNVGVFEARYDRMYCSANLQPTSVIDTISKIPCPNDVEPSDHLPIGASFKLSELN